MFTLASCCCVRSGKSGHGILEFSTDKAGQDVTPLNLEFGEEDKQQSKSSSGALNSITGMFYTALHGAVMWHVSALLSEAREKHCNDLSALVVITESNQ
jgi:hypothetical protein